MAAVAGRTWRTNRWVSEEEMIIKLMDGDPEKFERATNASYRYLRGGVLLLCREEEEFQRDLLVSRDVEGVDCDEDASKGYG